MAKLNSSDIALELSEKMGISKTAAKAYMDFIFESILTHAENGDEVCVSRFGKFRMAVTAPRGGVNVHNGERIRIGAKTRLKFEMSRWLKSSYDKADKELDGGDEDDESSGD